MNTDGIAIVVTGVVTAIKSGKNDNGRWVAAQVDWLGGSERIYLTDEQERTFPSVGERVSIRRVGEKRDKFTYAATRDDVMVVERAGSPPLGDRPSGPRLKPSGN